jgi:hypothetical protein
MGGSVPLPANTYGPFTYIPGEERLVIPQNASDLVRGQQLYMSNEKGENATTGFQTDKIANVSTGGAPGIVLSFPTNSNFDKFKVGDAVQGGAPYSTFFTGEFQYPGTIAPPNEWLFDDPQDANTEAVYSRWDGSLLTWATPYFASALEVRLIYRSSGSHTVFINGIDLTGIIPTTISGDYTITLSGYGGGLQSIAYTGSDGANYFALKQIYVDGVRLLDFDPTLITAINAAANTMTVDGGSWKGSDGSGTPDGQTEIATSYSGSGSVSTGFDGAILLRESNKEWVDGFYVTAPEQRIAARKLFPAAIKRTTK